MMDLSNEFNTFYQKICLNAFQKKMIRNLRQSLHIRIRRYFYNKLKLRPPVFYSRGRQATTTSIAPNSIEFLVEEAVLLQHLDKDTLDMWPEPAILHRLILGSIRDQSPDPSMDRKYSVCLHYAGLYRTEISILAPGPDGILIGINDEGWQPDIQKNLADWFRTQVKHKGLQLQRVACYLNAWADFQPNRLNGFAWLLPLDILAARYFRADIDREDNSLARTAAAIAEAVLCDSRWPASLTGDNSLSWSLSLQENQIFFRSLENLVQRSRLAVKTSDKTHACAIWRSLLGDRFPMAGENIRKFKGSRPLRSF